MKFQKTQTNQQIIVFDLIQNEKLITVFQLLLDVPFFFYLEFQFKDNQKKIHYYRNDLFLKLEISFLIIISSFYHYISLFVSIFSRP